MLHQAFRSDKKKLYPASLRQDLLVGTQPLDQWKIGPSILNQPSDQKFFISHYLDKEAAQQDYQRVQNQVSQARILPPLMVEGAVSQDFLVPVQVLTNGRLKKTTGSPDLILFFHPSGAITVQIIKTQPFHWIELAITVLYALPNQGQALTLSEFTILYDSVRHDYLNQHRLLNR